MPRESNAFEDYTSIKPLKNKHNKFFIMLERNSINVHSNTRPSRTANLRTGWPYLGDFGIFFKRFS